MAEYIEREALLKAYLDLVSDLLPEEELTETEWVGLINAAPAADVVPKDFHERCLEIEIQERLEIAPKHGLWEPRQDAIGFVRCSVCHDCNVYDNWADGKKWNYCPNCGARMDGDDDDGQCAQSCEPT